MKTFAANLKHFREKQGHTQDILAELSGVSAATICHYERSRRTPGMRNLQKLAKALGVTVDRLLEK